jgi:hypothetical protein
LDVRLSSGIWLIVSLAISANSQSVHTLASD